jgi:hypothetical protein
MIAEAPWSSIVRAGVTGVEPVIADPIVGGI